MAETAFQACKWVTQELQDNEYMTGTLKQAEALLDALTGSGVHISKCIISRDTREVKIHLTDDFKVYRGPCGPWKFSNKTGLIETYTQYAPMANFIWAFMKGIEYGR